jgi:hypothetical protein
MTRSRYCLELGVAYSRFFAIRDATRSGAEANFSLPAHIRHLVLALLLLAIFSVDALSLVPESLEATVRRADKIVTGSIVAATSRWAPGNKWILTDYQIRVDNVVAGSGIQAGETIDLVVWGGTVGKTTMKIAGFERPRVGKRYLGMLSKKPRKGTQHASPFVGMDRGLFELDGRNVLEVAGKRPLVALMGSTGIFRASEVPESASGRSQMKAASLDELVGWIRSVVAAGSPKSRKGPPKSSGKGQTQRLLSSGGIAILQGFGGVG